jgi:hypothetical protein
MDKTLSDLFTAWWMTGDKDAARVLADRLQELSSEQVAEVLMTFRDTVHTLPALADQFRRVGEAMGRAFETLARALAGEQPPRPEGQ